MLYLYRIFSLLSNIRIVLVIMGIGIAFFLAFTITVSITVSITISITVTACIFGIRIAIGFHIIDNGVHIAHIVGFELDVKSFEETFVGFLAAYYHQVGVHERCQRVSVGYQSDRT